MIFGKRIRMLWCVIFILTSLTFNGHGVSGQNVTDLEQRVEVLEVEVANMEDEIDDVETDLDLQTNRIDNVEDDVSQNTNNIFEISNDLDDVEDTTNLLLEQIGILEARINFLENVVTELDNSTDIRLDVMEIELQDLGGTVDSMEADLQGLESVVTDLDESVDGLELSVNVTSASLDVLHTEVQELDESTDARLTALEEILVVPWDACNSSPCNNGASCIDVNVDTFVCLCRDGYFGVTCEDSYSDTSFLASFDVSSLNPTEPNPIVFDVAVLNNGGHYDVTTGIYTVPIDGTYEFSFHVWSAGDGWIKAFLVIDDVRVNLGFGGDPGTNPVAQVVVVLPMTSGQQVWVEPSSIEGMYGASSGEGMYSWFTGHLVHAT